MNSNLIKPIKESELIRNDLFHPSTKSNDIIINDEYQDIPQEEKEQDICFTNIKETTHKKKNSNRNDSQVLDGFLSTNFNYSSSYQQDDFSLLMEQNRTHKKNESFIMSLSIPKNKILSVRNYLNENLY